MIRQATFPSPCRRVLLLGERGASPRQMQCSPRAVRVDRYAYMVAVFEEQRAAQTLISAAKMLPAKDVVFSLKTLRPPCMHAGVRRASVLNNSF